eukprot:SAG11_NODE_16647_length_541_cov_1.294118_1_plen_75_part_10
MKASEELEATTVTYVNLINACDACGELERAFDVLGEMEASGCIPNAATYCALGHACLGSPPPPCLLYLVATWVRG